MGVPYNARGELARATGGSVMDDAKFGQLARAFAKNVSRRLSISFE